MKRMMVFFVVLGLVSLGTFVTCTSARVMQYAPFDHKVSGEWNVTIDVYAGGHTYCIIGEKQYASDGVDGFDVPLPPFEPPGRCFVFIKQPLFPLPHNSLWMEWRSLNGVCRVWNLSLFYIPMGGAGADVSICWDMAKVCSSGYPFFVLWNNGVTVNMRSVSSYSFYSGAYQMTNMKIFCSKMSVL